MNALVPQHVTDVLRGIWQGRWIGLVVAWLTAIAGGVFVFLVPDRYAATARVYVDTQSLLKPRHECPRTAACDRCAARHLAGPLDRARGGLADGHRRRRLRLPRAGSVRGDRARLRGHAIAPEAAS